MPKQKTGHEVLDGPALRPQDEIAPRCPNGYTESRSFHERTPQPNKP